jgi:hypothetical protein
MATATFVLAYLLIAVAQVAVVIAAFRTSIKLGVMALFVPIYVVSFGNHRLKTEHRKRLAIAWWVGLAALVIAVVASPR